MSETSGLPPKDRLSEIDRSDKVEVKINIPKFGVCDWFYSDLPKDRLQLRTAHRDLIDEIDMYLDYRLNSSFKNKIKNSAES